MGSSGQNLSGPEFEDEVRRIARALWPSSANAGAQNLAGRERDGVFETEEAIHVLECTTKRTKEKARHDLDKIRGAIKQLRRADKPAVGWFVTASEPTADQRGLLRPDEPIRVMSFAQFRSKLIDSMLYLEMREDYAFGSARNPLDGAIHVPDAYVPVRLDLEDRSGRVTSVDEIAGEIESGSRFLLLGDYGGSTRRSVVDGL